LLLRGVGPVRRACWSQASMCVMTRWHIPGALRRVSRPVPLSVVLASVLLFLSSVLWAVVVPGLQAPDELMHANSVLRVAEGGGWPRPTDARVEDELFDAWELAGGTRDGMRTVLPGTPNGAPGATLFADVDPPEDDDRASFHELDDGSRPGGSSGMTSYDQMTQHPPGHYAVAALVYDLVGAGEWRYDRALFLLRALTALMIAGTVPVCCYVAARELSGREAVGKVAAFVPLFIPQLHYIGGAVTNDGATIAAASALWALLLTIACSGPTRTRLLLLAVAMAAACWTKGTALSLLPCVPVGIAIGYRRARGGRLRHWALPASLAIAATSALAFVLGGWWWAVNLIRYGRLQPAGVPIREASGDVLDPVEFLRIFLARIRWTFFGEVGVREPHVLNELTFALAVCFVVLCAVGLMTRDRFGGLLVMVLGMGTTVGMLFATTYSAHLTTKGLPGIQGRYLFVLVVPLAVLVAAGVVRVAGLVRLPTRWLLPAVALSGTGVAVLGVVLAFRVFYTVSGRPRGDAFHLLLDWAPWPPVVLAGLLAALLLCAFVTAWVEGRESGGEPTPDRRATSGAATGDEGLDVEPFAPAG
jgi:hypothetical protein